MIFFQLLQGCRRLPETPAHQASTHKEPLPAVPAHNNGLMEKMAR
jgi:hypothetical protein